MDYSQDWFTQNIKLWEFLLKPLSDNPIKAIEIGSFEGRSTIWLCENVLTHKDSHIDCVDPYQPYLEMNLDLDMEASKKRFFQNTKPYKDKITMHQMKSDIYLKARTEMADLIYVDGDHTYKACLKDMVQSHLLLKPDGIMIIDDYLWAGMLEGPDLPKGAVNSFMAGFAEEYSLLSIGYQVILKKNDIINKEIK